LARGDKQNEGWEDAPRCGRTMKAIGLLAAEKPKCRAAAARRRAELAEKRGFEREGGNHVRVFPRSKPADMKQNERWCYSSRRRKALYGVEKARPILPERELNRSR
jgi:hypothetical protein